MKTFIINLILIISLTSCQNTVKPVLVDVRAMPPEPEWVVFTRKPIIEKIESDYRVSDEFVEYSLQLKTHNERVKNWKIENQVP